MSELFHFPGAVKRDAAIEAWMHDHAGEPGGAFEAGPGYDAWVDGNVPCVALDFAPVSDE